MFLFTGWQGTETERHYTCVIIGGPENHVLTHLPALHGSLATLHTVTSHDLLFNELASPSDAVL